MTIDEAIKDLEYGSKQLEMEIKSGLWIKGSESELRCKEGITINKQHIEWLKELKDLREENKVLIQKCDKLIKEKGADVQPVKHGRWIDFPECLEYDGALDEEYIVCSECHHVWNTIDNCAETFRYCPNCGSKNKDGDSE